MQSAFCSIALVRGPDAVQRVFRITDTEARLPFIRAERDGAPSAA